MTNNKVKLDYWLKLYIELRDQGAYPLADQLREMLRRMGYEVIVKVDETVIQEIL